MPTLKRHAVVVAAMEQAKASNLISPVPLPTPATPIL